MSHVATKSVTLYTKDNCKFCHRTEELLKKTGEWKLTTVRNNVPIDDIHSKHQDVPETHRTYPVILIDGVFLGGWNEIKEPVLEKSASGFVFPQRDRIQYPDILALAEKHEAVVWPLTEVHGFEDDATWWKTIDEDKKILIKKVLAFFAAADGIVLENLDDNFTQSFSLWSINMMYKVQSYMEAVHAKTYSELIYNFIKDPAEVDEIINSTAEDPAVKRKAEWALKWMNPDRPLLLRLIAFVFIEGCFFSSSFASIFWLEREKHRGALTFSNLLISRDEGIHEEAGCLIASKFRRKATQEQIHEMAREAMEIECEFARQIIPNRMNGMNSDMMDAHVKFIGDRILKGLGYEPLHPDVDSPFPNVMQSVRIMGNFFEGKIHEYTVARDMRISKNEDF